MGLAPGRLAFSLRRKVLTERRQKYYHARFNSDSSSVESTSGIRAHERTVVRAGNDGPRYHRAEQFARERQRERVVRSRYASRLADVLFDARRDGSRRHVDYRVTGFVTRKDQPAVRIEVAAAINLRCQRCLERLDFPLALQREIVLVAGVGRVRAAGGRGRRSVDTIPALSRIDLRELVEEEVLLALPMAPRHARRVPSAARREQVLRRRECLCLCRLARLKH